MWFFFFCSSTISCIMSQSEYCCYDLLRHPRAKRKKIWIYLLSFYPVWCICNAINVVCSSHHLQELKKKLSMKTEREIWIWIKCRDLNVLLLDLKNNNKTNPFLFDFMNINWIIFLWGGGSCVVCEWMFSVLLFRHKLHETVCAKALLWKTAQCLSRHRP